MSEPSITCPVCGATSYHPADIAERYCGRCHAFHDDEIARALGDYDPLLDLGPFDDPED